MQKHEIVFLYKMGDSQRAASCMLCDVSMKHLRILDKWRTEGVAGLEIDRKSSPKEMGNKFCYCFWPMPNFIQERDRMATGLTDWWKEKNIFKHVCTEEGRRGVPAVCLQPSVKPRRGFAIIQGCILARGVRELVLIDWIINMQKYCQIFVHHLESVWLAAVPFFRIAIIPNALSVQ